jgi:hypothetical protein
VSLQVRVLVIGLAVALAVVCGWLVWGVWGAPLPARPLAPYEGAPYRVEQGHESKICTDSTCVTTITVCYLSLYRGGGISCLREPK